MSKGKRREREAAELYERAGYETFRPQESKFGETDMFGLFDLVAVQQGQYVRFAQVKSNKASGIEAWMKEVVADFPVSTAAFDFLVCHDRQGWRLFEVGLQDNAPLVDERSMDCQMGEGVVEWLSER